MMLNWNEIETGVVISFIGAAAGWVFHSILKLQKDVSACFRKLRKLGDEPDERCDTDSGH